MTIIVKDSDTIINEMIIYLQDNLTGIVTDFNPGSVIRVFTEAVALQLGVNSNITTNVYGQLQAVYNAAFISTSTGSDLDKLVELVGVTRKAATQAVGVVRFYSIPAPVSDITITAGTQVSTQPDAAGQRVIFTVDADTTLPALSTSTDVNVTALVAGAAGNVAANVITYLATPVSGITSITNLSPTSSGTDTETDDDLRDRAKHAVEVSGNATVSALTYAILGIDGVGSCTIYDLPQRTVTNEQHTYVTGTLTYALNQPEVIDDGTFAIVGTFTGAPGHTFLKNTDYQVDTANDQVVWLGPGSKPDNGTIFYATYHRQALGEADAVVAGVVIPMSGPILANVVATIALHKSAGILVNVIEPTLVLQNVSATATIKSGYDPTATKALITTAITNLLNTQPVGNTLYKAEIVQSAMNVAGCENIVVSTPASDVTVTSTQVIRAGTITVS
jgi:uncharacterized phage protein gp47/JayE